jgi:hypothetical protein
MTMESVMYINEYGDQEWYVNGMLHRIDGPAVIKPNGSQYWWVDGKRHRTDGPAIIEAEGLQIWMVNYQFHRTDGPAVIHPNGSQEWWIKDLNITDEVTRWMRKQKVKWPWNEEIQVQFALTFT